MSEEKTYTKAELEAAKDKVRNYWKNRLESLEKKAFEAGSKMHQNYKGAGVMEVTPVYKSFEDYKGKNKEAETEE